MGQQLQAVSYSTLNGGPLSHSSLTPIKRTLASLFALLKCRMQGFGCTCLLHFVHMCYEYYLRYPCTHQQYSFSSMYYAPQRVPLIHKTIYDHIGGRGLTSIRFYSFLSTLNWISTMESFLHYVYNQLCIHLFLLHPCACCLVQIRECSNEQAGQQDHIAQSSLRLCSHIEELLQIDKS